MFNLQAGVERRKSPAAGSWSAMVAVTMPLFGHLFDVHRYSAAFWMAAAIPLAGYLGWLALSSRRDEWATDTL